MHYSLIHLDQTLHDMEEPVTIFIRLDHTFDNMHALQSHTFISDITLYGRTNYRFIHLYQTLNDMQGRITDSYIYIRHCMICKDELQIHTLLSDIGWHKWMSYRTLISLDKTFDDTHRLVTVSHTFRSDTGWHTRAG